MVFWPLKADIRERICSSEDVREKDQITEFAEPNRASSGKFTSLSRAVHGRQGMLKTGRHPQAIDAGHAHVFFDGQCARVNSKKHKLQLTRCPSRAAAQVFGNKSCTAGKPGPQFEIAMKTTAPGVPDIGTVPRQRISNML